MVSLVRHPHTPPGSIQSVEARLEREEGGFVATFIVRGDLDRLVVPPRTEPVRTDDLWQTTCFEMFVGTGGTSYREFNFSPSGAWAAYDFTAFREGMRDARAEVLIRVDQDADRLVLLAHLRSDLSRSTPVGLTAVIEETDGRIRYWATSFEPGKPEFHAPGVRSLLLGEVEAE